MKETIFIAILMAFVLIVFIWGLIKIIQISKVVTKKKKQIPQKEIWEIKTEIAWFLNQKRKKILILIFIFTFMLPFIFFLFWFFWDKNFVCKYCQENYRVNNFNGQTYHKQNFCTIICKDKYLKKSKSEDNVQIQNHKSE